MEKKKYSEEDLRALLSYIASNPAIPFPALTKKQRDELIKDVLGQMDDLRKSYENPSLVIDLIKSTSKKFER